ncbi:uncharacterized protein LOC116929459 [Daphnia magna]|uniref:uncharacterized protein LOC116929459 n=1 Tax=Daphnia magna TaxID=35525 RepID=UPI001E1BADA3|nr:uncharacterized protein LOC116929459 [Daphnia magna]
MGICMDTGRNQLIIRRDIDDSPTAFGSWPRQSNGSFRYQRVQNQARTMSEPIMVVSENMMGESNHTVTESSSSGPGPPKRIPLTLQRKIVPIDSELPEIPILFVLGGPGSGKITHCDRLTRLDPRLFHLNMQSEYLKVASEIGSRDPNIVPAYKALEILIQLMSGTKDSSAMIVTGYPRNMRDVVEFLARVQRVDAVILLDWSDRSLERQIQLGAKTGDIDINLARFEMTNYKSNIIPVAQFFDQQGRLHIVAGQRSPSEIFDDLAEEVNGIVSSALGELPVSQNPKVSERPESAVTEIHSEQEETKVVIHTLHEDVNQNGAVKRQQSVDSVDMMIEEEIKNIITEDPKSATDKNKETPALQDIEVEEALKQ